MVPGKQVTRFEDKVFQCKEPTLPYMEEQRHRHGNSDKAEEYDQASKDGELTHSRNLKGRVTIIINSNRESVCICTYIV